MTPMTHPTGHSIDTLLDGLVFGESPRWHDGRLWLSDMGASEVHVLAPGGGSEVVARPEGGLSGIAFAPDGRLLIVASRAGRLLALEPDGSLSTHADLTRFGRPVWNDLVVDGRGNAYVGDLGFDFGVGAPFAPGGLYLVRPDGSATRVADDLAFPNGLAVTPDNETLVVAESYANRLTAFDIAADGGLANRRVWADLPGAYPDGICLDADGAAWYADVPNRCCARVREGGEVLEVIELELGCFACTLGGPDGRTLFLAAAAWTDAPTLLGATARTGVVLATAAPAARAGWP